MSWKGFTKAVARLPQQIKASTGSSDVTKDTQFLALEKKFHELEKTTEKLHEDAQKYRDAVVAMLNHQADSAVEVAEIYQPTMGQQTGEGAVLKRVQPTPQQSLQAANDYRSAMLECRDQVMPELDAFDRRVLQPTADLREILKVINKTITKRNHKQIDYDRFRVALKKLRDKPERSLADEKQVFKLEGQLDVATREFDAINDALKQDLPYFFQLKIEFIDPIFQLFYFIQCRLFAILCDHLGAVIRSGHFDPQLGIVAAFETHKGTARDVLESLQLIRRTGGTTASSLDRFGASGESPRTGLAARAIASKTPSQDSPPPPYSGIASPPPSAPAATGISTASLAAAAHSKRPPPPLPPARKPAVVYVEALYDYDAQAEGDLTLRKGDRIEVIERTADVNDWWTGRIKGTVGVFPGNYVTDV